MSAPNPLAVVPPALKKITLYIRRAEELDKDTVHPESKAVAYYCRTYAMDQGMLLRDANNAKEVMPFLIALMDRLEQDKKTLPVYTPAEGKALVQTFADKVFTKADEDDQLGVWDKNTARTFYAAGVFYDVMQQFKGLLGPEIEKKRKYCKWKATDILTALKEGRAPTQGGGGFAATAGGGAEGGGEGEEGGGLAPPSTAESKSSTSSSSSSLPPPPPPPYSATLGGGGISSPTPASPPPFSASPTSRSPPPYIQVVPPAAPLAPAPAAPPAPAPKPPATSSSSSGSSSKGGVGVSPKQAVLDDAKELCYFAISAIQHKETALAIDRLEKALGKLKGL